MLFDVSAVWWKQSRLVSLETGFPVQERWSSRISGIFLGFFFFFKVNWSLPVMLETVQPRELELTKRTPNTPMFQDFQESSISFLGSLKYYSVKVLILLGSAFIFHPSICPAIQAWLYLVSIYSSVCSSLPLWAESMSVFISTRLLSGCRWDLLWDFLHAFVRAYKKPLLSECLLLPLVLMCFIERLWIIESSSERSVSRGFAEEEGGDRRIPPVNTPQNRVFRGAAILIGTFNECPKVDAVAPENRLGL